MTHNVTDVCKVYNDLVFIPLCVHERGNYLKIIEALFSDMH